MLPPIHASAAGANRRSDRCQRHGADGHGFVADAELLELPRIEAVSAPAETVTAHVARFRQFLDS